jgi:diguanylate cyclase
LALERELAATQGQMSTLHRDLDLILTECMQDALTMLSNRKAFDLGLARAIAGAEGTSEPFSLLLIDIDHFKRFNDIHGHLAGDQVLRLVAAALKQRVRSTDLTARYGGEEFAIILPSTALRLAKPVAEQLRLAVMGKDLVRKSNGENLGKVTVSIGVAAYRPGDRTASILERADECLYAAKRAGRNLVVGEDETQDAAIGAVA